MRSLNEISEGVGEVPRGCCTRALLPPRSWMSSKQRLHGNELTACFLVLQSFARCPVPHFPCASSSDAFRIAWESREAEILHQRIASCTHSRRSEATHGERRCRERMSLL